MGESKVMKGCPWCGVVPVHYNGWYRATHTRECFLSKQSGCTHFEYIPESEWEVLDAWNAMAN